MTETTARGQARIQEQGGGVEAESSDQLCLRLGVKTDSVEYRYSYAWLFRLLRDEDIHYIQLGTFCEFYHLPDDYFVRLRQLGEAYDVRIASVFTAHRELGGFFRNEHPGWEVAARRNYERLIEVGALLGADSVGSNPGSVVRDQMEYKDQGMRCYLRHMKELMEYAHEVGVSCLTAEVMSCLAEPPTVPTEIHAVAEELLGYHRQNPSVTASFGYCADIAHCYADKTASVRYDQYELLAATLPYLCELHLKNTDARCEKGFGFSPQERQEGIIDVSRVRDYLRANADTIPRKELIGYLEIDGPKKGRDYTDPKLDAQLRRSLAHLREAFH